MLHFYFDKNLSGNELSDYNKSFELPPLAPGINLDVRIESEGTNGLYSYAADLSVPVKKRIILRSGELNSPIRLKWDNDGLEPGRYFLKDPIRGSETDMATANELTIPQQNSEYTLEFVYKTAAQVVQDYRLGPNYPNPFNPTTRITYAIADPGLVSLTVFNMLGQEVKTLVNTVQSSGNYNVLWDATDNSGRSVGAGIYIYRLQVNNFVEIRKMVLIK